MKFVAGTNALLLMSLPPPRRDIRSIRPFITRAGRRAGASRMAALITTSSCRSARLMAGRCSLAITPFAASIRGGSKTHTWITGGRIPAMCRSIFNIAFVIPGSTGVTACWGLTASDDPGGYKVHAPGEGVCGCASGNVSVQCCKRHAPDEDNGVIAPTAALSSFPYAPEAALRAMRYFYEALGDRLWGRFGFTDAFSEDADWFSNAYLAIDQGPIVAMIENHRTGLLWSLFMRDPDVQAGLRRLGFRSPHLK